MSITPNSRNARSRFQEWMQRQADRRVAAAIGMLDTAGLDATREMRTGRRYTDRTGNLRSSTGYAVIYNGKIVRGGTPEAVSTTGREGAREGRKLVRGAVSDIGQGNIALVLFAGMRYAYYVERMGLNVTDSGVALARRDVDAMAKALGFEIKT